MIIDKISNTDRYDLLLYPRLKKALDYLQKVDFNTLKAGKFQIEGEDIYMLVQEYQTREDINCRLEGHEKYIDIQYIYSGQELIGMACHENTLQVIDSDQLDCFFYKTEHVAYFIKLKQGMFAIFFSSDLHMPCIKVSESEIVKKIVIKVRL